MTTDGSIRENSKLKPGENMLCTEIVSDIQNNFCTKHVLPHVLQKEEFLKKIYLYMKGGKSQKVFSICPNPQKKRTKSFHPK